MRRLALILTVFMELVAASAMCDDAALLSSQAIQQFGSALTPAGFYGSPRYTTALLPPCTDQNPGGVAFDTTVGTMKFCDGVSAYVSLGSVTLASGTTPITGCQNRVPYGNNSNVLECEAAFTYDTATNILTVPNATLAGTQNVTGAMFFSSGATFGDTELTKNTTLTPDNFYIGVGTTGEAVHVGEYQDGAFDFNNGRAGTAAFGDPTLVIHSRNQSAVQYLQLSAQNATGMGEVQTNLAGIHIGGSKATITEASPQAIIRVGIPTSTNVYGMTVFYTIYDINGANYVGRTGSVKVQGGNSSGTAICTINTTQDAEGEDGSQIVTSNAATLTYTWTNVVSTTNCDLSLNAASSEGANTYAITWTAYVTGNSASITVTPQ